MTVPTGPLGFPRITEIGPFVDVKADNEYNRDVDENTLTVGSDVDREIATIHNIDLNNVTEVQATLIVREQVEEGDDIIGKIRESVETATRDNTIAKMIYWFDTETQIGKIIDVFVEKDFRNLGIATTMKEREMEFMKDNGINLLYTDVVSEGGFRLAKRTGFRPVDELDELRRTESTLQFFRDRNRGIMFTTL